MDFVIIVRGRTSIWRVNEVQVGFVHIFTAFRFCVDVRCCGGLN